MGKTESDHISVCICTYKRPAFLSRLLQGLERQITNGLFTYSIIIVDNDVGESAKEIAISFREKAFIDIRYCVEPRKGIALARNKGIANAKGRFVAFIDDDEVPDENWLYGLYRMLVDFKADGVLGPVIPYFEVEPPKWVTKGKFCERPRYKTGAPVHWRNCRTGNVMLNGNLFSGNTHPFDPAFGIQGEDVKFFKEMYRKGRRFIWCDDAPVFEIVPPDRTRKAYFLRRAFVQGNISFLYDREEMTPLKLIRMVFKSGLASVLYTSFLPISYLGGLHKFMKYLIKDVHHISRLLAISGLAAVKERKY